MNFINLTPHPITVINQDGESVTFSSQGVARVSVRTETMPSVGGFRLQKQVFGEVENLPDATEGVVFIVSGMVLSQCKNRADVVAPDTGRDAVRNDQGQIIAVKGFVSA
jgi:hypothetical protein